MTSLLLTLLAASTTLTGSEVDPQGWTHDGRYFVVKTTGGYDSDNPFTVLDTKTGSEVPLSDEDAYDLWHKAHPLAPLEVGRSPKTGGKAVADVKLVAGKAAGAWNTKVEEDRPVDSHWEPVAPAGAELRVERDGSSWVSVRWTGGIASAVPYWSPGGKQVAWLVRANDWGAMDGTRTAAGGHAGTRRVSARARRRRQGPAGRGGAQGERAPRRQGFSHHVRRQVAQGARRLGRLRREGPRGARREGRGPDSRRRHGRQAHLARQRRARRRARQVREWGWQVKLAWLIALAPLAALADDAPGNVTSMDGITKDGRYLMWSEPRTARWLPS